MKLFNLLIMLLLLSCNSIELSEEQQRIKESAVEIKNLSNLNDKVYQEILDYDVIMVGEMHGTKEPSEFAFGLCELISKKEQNVILGIEIPSSQMYDYNNNMSLEEIKELGFFREEGSDGRNGEAWLDLLDRCNKNEAIKIKFIDSYRLSTRDSSMYKEVCDIRKEYANAKIVTLTGNIHNWLKPFSNEIRLGGLLIRDTINFNSNKIMSINHIYNEGTMLNNMGNGLELTTLKGKENIFNKTLSAKMFLSKRVYEDQNQYTHFLYTDKVTHSDQLKKDDNM